MNANVLEIGEAYLKALDRKDVQTIISLVDLDIRFKTPVEESFTRDDFIMSVRRMLINLRGVHITAKFSSGEQAIFTYEMNFNEPVGIVKTASIMAFAGDKIKDIEVFFDARPFERVYGAFVEMKMAA